MILSHTLKWSKRWTIHALDIMKPFLKFNLKPQIRTVVCSHTISLERKNSTFSINEELKISELLSCTVLIYMNLVPPSKVSNRFLENNILFFQCILLTCKKALPRFYARKTGNFLVS